MPRCLRRGSLLMSISQVPFPLIELLMTNCPNKRLRSYIWCRALILNRNSRFKNYALLDCLRFRSDAGKGHNAWDDRARERHSKNDEKLASRAPVDPVVRRLYSNCLILTRLLRHIHPTRYETSV
jgi:hypothetical protein